MRLNKAEQELQFVQELLNDGGELRAYAVQYDRGHHYWFFLTGNRTARYWTDMSRKNLRKLGVSDDYCPEVR